MFEPLAEGDYFEMVRLIDDETEVRGQAQQAIARAVAEGQLSRRHEVMLTADFVYEDLDAVRQRFVAIDIDRAELFDARRDEIGCLFRSGGVATGQGRRFTQVFRLDVLA